MNLISYVGLFLCAIFFIYQKLYETKNTNIPWVGGSLPFVGHGFNFSKDIIGFIRKCYAKYGKIFKIKIFRTTFAVICDRELISEFFKLNENEMSMYDVLSRLFFGEAFSDEPESLDKIIKLVKSTVAVRFDEFVPKIYEEAKITIDRMKNLKDKEIRLADEMIRFVSCTSSRCFVGIELNQETYDALIKFTHLLNSIVVYTYFLPKSILKIIFGNYLKKYRLIITKYFENEIETYRKDPNKKDSLLIRYAVDHEDNLSNQMIGDIIVCLLYVSSENTALGLTASLTDLASNDELWYKFQAESNKYLSKNDIKGLFKSQFIDNCIMESARLNSHIFALNRAPKKTTQIGEYDVSDVDVVALCEPMLMSYEASKDIFSDPLKYNPYRFENESKDAQSVMTWGAGVHLCPGKMFALYEIKLALALITNNYSLILPEKIPNLNYFSPSAFSERQLKVKISEPKIKISYYEPNSWLIQNYFSIDKQKEIYENLLKIKKDDLIDAKAENPIPLSYHNLVYTGSSNCFEYAELLTIGNDIIKYLPDVSKEEYNSFYSQLYGLKTIMKKHKDEYVDWGVSISLGASCDFSFNDKNIILKSGDVFISDFSQIYHSVDKIYDDKPEWYNAKFNRIRCSIQIRSVKNKVNTLISENDFKNMINKDINN